jgi:CHAT domain-containing protein
VAPSASFLLASLERNRAIDRSSQVLSVANSVAIPSEGLSALPGAADEARFITRMFPHSLALVDRDATLENLRASITGANILHFSGHTVANAEYPELSRLFVSDGHNGAAPIYARDLRLFDVVALRLVVLASCSGVSGPTSHSEAVLGIARGFLSAGVPTVIAARWEVADAATGRIMQHLYSGLAGGAQPIRALADAARQAIRSQEPPRAWAAWVLLGA